MHAFVRHRLAGRLAVLAIFSLALPAAAQELPAGPGRDELAAACTVCHGLDNITDPHRPFSAAEWEAYLYDMVARGAPLDQADFETVRRYLVDNFAAR